MRLVAASNRDLRAEVNAGRFRADLFYRLAVVRLTLPPLRQRPDDIAPIAERLLTSLGAPEDQSATLLSPAFLARLEASSWPGNVRELRNHLERCLVFHDAMLPARGRQHGGGPDAGDPRVDARSPYTDARRRAVDDFERAYVKALLELHGKATSPAPPRRPSSTAPTCTN